MSDGDYNNGSGDPDYYDLEFRLNNPDVYGNDEYMMDMYPPQTQRQKPATQNRSRRNGNDEEFSPEYLQWKAMHPDRVEYFQKHAGKGQNKAQDDLSGCDGMISIIAIMVVAFFIIFLLFG